MKNLLLALFTLFCFASFGQKATVVKIHTNAQCGDCKQRIETALNQEKGVVYAELDLETKMVEVKYKTKKTELASLQRALNLVGYDADEKKADAAAQRALPLCCQPGGH